jgi:hypothetical protein
MDNLLRNFKYRTRDAALLDLIEESVYFSKPSQFHETNDTLEGEFEILNSDSLWRIIIQAINSIEIKKHGHPLVSSGFRWSAPEKQLILISNESFNSQANRLGICSTSKSYDNQAMWAHYCKNEGICFEFEWDQRIIDDLGLLIREVTYSNKPRKVNRDRIFKNMIIEYGIENPHLTIEELINHSLSKEFSTKWIQSFILESSCVKRNCWQYENEVRLLSPVSQSFHILKKILRSVYIFLPRFDSPNFMDMTSKSRLLRLILMQLMDKYPDVKLYGLSYDSTGRLFKEEIPYD